MRIKMLTSIAGQNFSLSPGDEADFSDDEAKRLIQAGYAEPVRVKRTATKSKAYEKR